MVGLVFVAAAVSSGCSTTVETTNTARSWTEQLLVTSAADRALADMRWPRLEGVRVFVETVAPGGNQDAAYLTAAAKMHLGMRGASVVDRREQADVVATLLAGSLGTRQTETLVGVPKTQSVLFPLPFPEIALYKQTMQDGFAKAELVVREPESGTIVFRDGPAEGRAYNAEYRVLLLAFVRADVEDEPSEPEDRFE